MENGTLPQQPELWVWAACALLALVLHLGIWAALQQPTEIQGNALGAGSHGVTVGLGQVGSSADLIKQLKVVEPEAEARQPEPEPQSPPQQITPPQPQPAQQAPTQAQRESNTVKTPVPEVPMPLPKMRESEGYQLAQADPKPDEPVAEPETETQTSAETTATTPATVPAENHLSSDHSKPANTESRPESEVAAVRGSGRADHQSTGGKFGTARDYLAHVMSWLMTFHQYPAQARKDKDEGIVKIEFRFDRQGHVMAFSIKESSGSKTLDEAALRMIQQASPLPPVPPEYFKNKKTLLLGAPVEYKLSD